MTFAVSRMYGRISKSIGTNNPRLLVAAYLAYASQYSLDELDGLYGSTSYAPPKLDVAERQTLEAFYLSGPAIVDSVWNEVPDWIHPRCKASLGPDAEFELAKTLGRAPVDLRINQSKASRDDVLSRLERSGMECIPTPYSPVGIRLSRHASLTGCELYDTGLIEIQDEGSQLAALLVGTKPGECVVDYCAGAGGKSLAMAAQMSGMGKVYAFDVSAKRLAPLEKRAKRAGAGNIFSLVFGTNEGEAAVSALKGKVDRVLIDAPCSGSGTWRRAPDAKWLLTQKTLHEYEDRQFEIINKASELLRPDGTLIYVTCSFLLSENEAQIERVLNENHQLATSEILQSWRKITGRDVPEGVSTKTGGLRLSPYRTETDGFYVHRLVRKQ